MGTGGFTPKVKQLEFEVDHRTAPSAEIKDGFS